MNEKIKRHVEGLFENAPQTRRAFELKDELIANLNDRYNDLVAEGKDEDTAYSTVISGIGDIDEIIRNLREQDVFDPMQEQMQRQKSALLISVAVAIYILSFLPAFVLETLMNNNTGRLLGVVMMFICWAFASMLLVYNSASKPKYKKTEDTIVEEFKAYTSNKRNSKAARNALISMVPVLITILYLILGFGFSLWHPGWMIFLLIPVIIQLIRLVGIYRGDD